MQVHQSDSKAGQAKRPPARRTGERRVPEADGLVCAWRRGVAQRSHEGFFRRLGRALQGVDAVEYGRPGTTRRRRTAATAHSCLDGRRSPAAAGAAGACCRQSSARRGPATPLSWSDPDRGPALLRDRQPAPGDRGRPTSGRASRRGELSPSGDQRPASEPLAAGECRPVSRQQQSSDRTYHSGAPTQIVQPHHEQDDEQWPHHDSLHPTHPQSEVVTSEEQNRRTQAHESHQQRGPAQHEAPG